MKLTKITLLVLFAAMALPLAAAPQTYTPLPGDGCGNVDPNKPCYAGEYYGARYESCTANYSQGQRCYDCVTNRYNKDVCGGVKFSAFCGCENKPVEGAAAGITECRVTGLCEFKYY